MSDNQPLSQERPSLRESVRAELEEARKQFFALLAIEMIIRSHLAHIQEHSTEIWRSLSHEPMVI